MGGARKHKSLFTASRLAELCQVDLKTIHNWADRGRIAHFRTPGRHLRFRREDVLDFLRKYGYPIPQEMEAQRPRVALMLNEAPERLSLRAALERDFEVVDYPDALAGLLCIGRNPPDAVLIGPRVGAVSGGEIVAALKQSENARHVRAVLVTNSRSEQRHGLEALHGGASAQVPASNLKGLRDTLQALMGTGR